MGGLVWHKYMQTGTKSNCIHAITLLGDYMSGDTSTGGTLNLKRDQRIVYDNLLVADRPIDLASAAGRGQRLLSHLKEVGAPREITEELESLVTTALNRLAQGDAWEEAVSEALAADAAEWVLDALADEDVEGLEVLTHLLVLDEHLCTLRALGREGEREMVVASVRHVVPARLYVCASISDHARRFIERHGPQGAWGEMWREVAEARETLDEAEAAFEAGLDARLEAIRKDGTIEVPAVLQAAFKAAGID